MQASVNGIKVTAVSRTNLSIKEVSVRPKPTAATTTKTTEGIITPTKPTAITTTPSLVEQTPRIQIKEGMSLNFTLLLAMIDDDFYYS